MGRRSVIHEDHPSSGSRFFLACARKLSKGAAFIPPTASEEDTCESINERYCHGHRQVSSSLAVHLTVRPLSLPRSTVNSGRPNVVAAFVRTNTEMPYGMVHKPGCVIGSLVQHIKSGSISREDLASFTLISIQCPCDSAVWISSLSGSRLLRSLLLEKVWVGSFDWFHLGNLSSHHPRARCFHHLVVFPGSCPL